MKPRFAIALSRFIPVVVGLIVATAAAADDFGEQGPLKESYPFAFAAIQQAQAIPELSAGFVPQGIASTPDGTTVLLSLYHDRGKRPSIVVLVDAASGRHLATRELYVGKIPLKGHVGGVAVCRGFLWVASEGELYRFTIPSRDADPDGILSASARFRVDSRADCLSSHGDLLWVGEFSHGRKYPTAAHHHGNGRRAWAAAYRVDGSGSIEATATYDSGGRDVLRPDAVVVIPDRVQGFAIRDDVVAICSSYGPGHSRLTVCESPLNEQPRSIQLPSGQTTSVYDLNERRPVVTMRLPAGAEDLEWSGRRLLVGFEGAADKYRARWSRSGAFIENRYYALTPVSEAVPDGTQVNLRIDATDPGWRRAGIRLSRGQSLAVRSEGRITLQKHRLDDYPYVTADGQASETRPFAGLRAPNGCLLVKVGETVYQAGVDVVIHPRHAGEVFIAILEKGDPSNNDGHFDVALQAAAIPHSAGDR